jgi:hypothetical protein
MNKAKYNHKMNQVNTIPAPYTGHETLHNERKRGRAHSLLPLDDESAISVDGDQRRFGPLQDEISLNDEVVIQMPQRSSHSSGHNSSNQTHPRPPLHPGHTTSSVGNYGHCIVRNAANTIHNTLMKREKAKHLKNQLHPTMAHLANTTGQSPSIDSPSFNDEGALTHLMQQQNNLKVYVDGDGDPGVDVGEGAFTNHSRDDTDRLPTYQD